MVESSQSELIGDTPAPRPQLVINYIKSTRFRVIHCDGVVGAPSPKGDSIHAALFSERLPIPVQTIHELEDGRVSGELSRVSRSGVVREVEVDVIFSLDMAEAMANWLLDHVQKIRTAIQSSGESAK
jgi:hypothetical protein